ncbi:MAG: L,D-transpeptidase [Myxococcota bacterium]|nr:L,D-transpeptidase [Myxococcota bacterium]
MDVPISTQLRLALAMLGAVAAALGGCKKKSPEGSAGTAALLDPDGGGEIVAIAGPDGGARAGMADPILHALALITPVMNVPEWPPRNPSTASDERKSALRLGYLRKGGTVTVKPQLVKKSNCPEGWYELLPPPESPPGTAGGFVCAKDATLDPNDKELTKSPHAPNLAGPLPYDYGLNLVDGAPLYRRPPLRRERKQYERGLAVGRAYRKDDDGAPAPEVATSHEDGNTAWYLTHKVPSQISMDDLKGETSLIVERMVKGFYLGLDTEVHAFAGSFWRTTRGMFVAKEHVLVHDPKVEFEGVWLDAAGATGETHHLPLGWITNPHQWKYTLDDSKMHRHEHVDRFTVVQLTGKKQVVDDKSYWETAEGWWMRAMDGTVTNPRPPPKNLASGERWIDVNLGLESLVAFEGEKPVFATIISSGRHDDDPAKDHHTRSGEFRIREKHIAATMDNDTATDGPYSIEDVPWIMYFDGSTALHGAFWHSRFGHERSHGCVNMTPHDAHELFGWVGPKLPDGWHGVRATDANPGTRVIVHDDGKTAEESKKDDDAKNAANSPAPKDDSSRH